MRQLDRFILHPITGKVFLSLLAGIYLIYLIAFGQGMLTTIFGPHETIEEQPINSNPDFVIQYWTTANMQSASDADRQIGTTSDLTQASSDLSLGKPAQQDGQPPRN